MMKNKDHDKAIMVFVFRSLYYKVYYSIFNNSYGCTLRAFANFSIISSVGDFKKFSISLI